MAAYNLKKIVDDSNYENGEFQALKIIRIHFILFFLFTWDGSPDYIEANSMALDQDYQYDDDDMDSLLQNLGGIPNDEINFN